MGRAGRVSGGCGGGQCGGGHWCRASETGEKSTAARSDLYDTNHCSYRDGLVFKREMEVASLSLADSYAIAQCLGLVTPCHALS